MLKEMCVLAYAKAIPKVEKLYLCGDKAATAAAISRHATNCLSKRAGDTHEISSAFRFLQKIVRVWELNVESFPSSPKIRKNRFKWCENCDIRLSVRTAYFWLKIPLPRITSLYYVHALVTKIFWLWQAVFPYVDDSLCVVSALVSRYKTMITVNSKYFVAHKNSMIRKSPAKWTQWTHQWHSEHRWWWQFTQFHISKMSWMSGKAVTYSSKWQISKNKKASGRLCPAVARTEFLCDLVSMKLHGYRCGAYSGFAASAVNASERTMKLKLLNYRLASKTTAKKSLLTKKNIGDRQKFCLRPA